MLTAVQEARIPVSNETILESSYVALAQPANSRLATRIARSSAADTRTRSMPSANSKVVLCKRRMLAICCSRGPRRRRRISSTSTNSTTTAINASMPGRKPALKSSTTLTRPLAPAAAVATSDSPTSWRNVSIADVRCWTSPTLYRPKKDAGSCSIRNQTPSPACESARVLIRAAKNPCSTDIAYAPNAKQITAMTNIARRSRCAPGTISLKITPAASGMIIAAMPASTASTATHTKSRPLPASARRKRSFIPASRGNCGTSTSARESIDSAMPALIRVDAPVAGSTNFEPASVGTTTVSCPSLTTTARLAIDFHHWSVNMTKRATWPWCSQASATESSGSIPGTTADS